MTDVAIDAETLKTIRKARKIGRPKLSKLSGMTERQVAKIEQSKHSTLPEAIAIRLAGTLQVPLQTLTGEQAMSGEDLQPAAKSSSGCSCCG